MPATDVTIEKGNSWALITLNSSGGINKLGSGTLAVLLDEIGTVVSDGCRCLGISGAGGSFAVGADLRELKDLGPFTAREFSDLGNSLFRIMENCRCIVVAGIDGFCLGGGLDLALAADWRIATSRSVFGHPGADLGLITGFGGTQRLPRLIGAGKACSMLYEARRISCHDARRVGLVQEIVRQDDFVTNLTERIRGFAGLSPEWISQVKGRFRDHSDGWLGIRRTHVPVG